MTNAARVDETVQPPLGLDRDRSGVDQLLEAEGPTCRDAQGDQGSGPREWREHSVQPGAVGHPRVDPRARVVETTSGLRRQSLREPPHSLVVGEPHLGVLKPVATVEVDVVWSVDEDVGDAINGQQRLERAHSQGLPAQRVDEREHGGAVGQALFRPQRRRDALGSRLRGVSGEPSPYAV